LEFERQHSPSGKKAHCRSFTDVKGGERQVGGVAIGIRRKRKKKQKKKKKDNAGGLGRGNRPNEEKRPLSSGPMLRKAEPARQPFLVHLDGIGKDKKRGIER